MRSAPLGRRRGTGRGTGRVGLTAVGEEDEGEEGAVRPTAAAVMALDAGFSKQCLSREALETGSEPSTCASTCRAPSVDATCSSSCEIQAGGGADGEEAAALGSISEADVALAKRMYADYGGSPSDQPDASLITKGAALPRIWRYRPHDSKLEVFVSDFELPVSVECFLAMTCATASRQDWDETAKEFRVLSTAGPAELRHLHGERGDEMVIYWLFSTPFPMPSREYLIHRKLCTLPPLAPNGPRPFLKIDRALDASAPEMQAPVARRAVRVAEYSQCSLIWARPDDGSTVVRTVYSENPMMPIPSWLQSFMTEKFLPRGFKALFKAAVDYEQKHGAARPPAAAHSATLP